MIKNRILLLLTRTIIILGLPISIYFANFPCVDSTWFYYLFSSIFQGISAILGLLLLWFVFIKDALWQKYFFDDNKLIQGWAQSNSKLLPSMAWPVLIELILTVLVALLGLAFIPVINNIGNPIRVSFAFFVIGLTLVAIIDFAKFIYWGITLDKKAPPDDNTDNKDTL